MALAKRFFCRRFLYKKEVEGDKEKNLQKHNITETYSRRDSPRMKAERKY